MVKFVLLTTQRSGSTFLFHWLTSHPNVRCHGELFLIKSSYHDNFRYYCEKDPLRQCAFILYRLRLLKYPDTVIKKLLNGFLWSLYNNPHHAGPKIYAGGKEYLLKSDRGWQHQPRDPEEEKAVGFKLMYVQLAYFNSLSDIFLKERFHIVHLIRRNKLKMYLSGLAVRKRGIVHLTKNVPPVRVLVDTKRLLRYFNDISVQQNKLRSVFSRNPYTEITYEDFFANYSTVSAKIADFLEVADNGWQWPKFKKLNPDSVKDIVENYDEVVAVLKGTPFEKYVD